MRYTKEEIAAILQKLRVAAGLTQKHVAEFLGKKQQTIASWESGQSQPDANTLFVLCDLYDISVDDAFGFTRKPNTIDGQRIGRLFEHADETDRRIVELTLGKYDKSNKREVPPVYEAARDGGGFKRLSDEQAAITTKVMAEMTDDDMEELP